jgi:hypothetical protein
LPPRVIAAAAISNAATEGNAEGQMGRALLLWLIGIPIPIIILLLIFWH